MRAMKGSMVYGPYEKRNDFAEWSIHELRESMRLYLENIEVVHTAVADMCQSFSEMGSIRPVECDVTLSSIQALCISVQGLCNLLNVPSVLPSVIVPHRYRL